MQKNIPIIDIFAGPGGLSEGFSRFKSFAESSVSFCSRLAIEKDPIAARTLVLRSFYRAFDADDVPQEFYEVIRGERPESALERFPEWKRAQEDVWNVELGHVDEVELHSRISSVLAHSKEWVLLGGPPCQAYSLVGRSRMTGVGAAARAKKAKVEELRSEKLAKFEADHRHELYREYLRIVAVHQPSVFVMENVKGILSSVLPARGSEPRRRVFDQIRNDLGDPWAALKHDPTLEVLRRFKSGKAQQYRLYSFAVAAGQGDQLDDRDFLIRSEDYGVPQKRHRVIILGIRSDIARRPRPVSKSKQATVRNAIETLPVLRSGISRGDAGELDWRAAISAAIKRSNYKASGKKGADPIIREFVRSASNGLTRGAPFLPSRPVKQKSSLEKWLSDSRIGGWIQHEARSHMPSDLARYLFVSATGQDLGRSPKLEEWPSSLVPLHRNVAVDSETGRPIAYGFSDRFKVQTWDKAASTITAHIAKDGHYFIHPDPQQCRSLTVREAARLQTFPDNYLFCGNRTQQYQQIGNAVPPFLAVQLASVVAEILSDQSGDKDE